MNSSETGQNKIWYYFIFFTLIVAFLLGSTFFVYHNHPPSGFSTVMSRIIPYPAVKLNNQWIKVYDVFVEYKLIAPTANVADGSTYQRIIDSIIQKRAIEQLTVLHNIPVDESIINNKLELIVGDPNANGWTVDQLKKRIAKPLAQAQVLDEWVSKDREIQTSVWEKAKIALDRLNNEDEFFSVAGDMSEDRNAILGGDMGFVFISTLPDSWQDSINKLEDDQFSPILESDDKLAIIQVKERIEKDDSIEQVHLAVVVFYKVDYEQVIREYLDRAEIKRYLNI
ncbi:MAG: peptidylprolyl isomerase [Patescibacteria group bacterium]